MVLWPIEVGLRNRPGGTWWPAQLGAPGWRNRKSAVFQREFNLSDRPNLSGVPRIATSGPTDFKIGLGALHELLELG